MPLPLMILATKGAVLAKTAGGLLAEWNALPPERREEVAGDAALVMRQLRELRGALGTKLFRGHAEDVSWDEAKHAALSPTIAFLTAKRAVELLVTAGEMNQEELLTRLGAVGNDDSVIAEALEIAADDGYIVQKDGGIWAVTDFADRQLVESEHVRFIESEIVDHLRQVGLAGRDELAMAIGAPGPFAPEYQAALERALVSGEIAWSAPGLYSLPGEQLATSGDPKGRMKPRPRSAPVLGKSRRSWRTSSPRSTRCDGASNRPALNKGR